MQPVEGYEGCRCTTLDLTSANQKLETQPYPQQAETEEQEAPLLRGADGKVLPVEGCEGGRCATYLRARHAVCDLLCLTLLSSELAHIRQSELTYKTVRTHV